MTMFYKIEEDKYDNIHLVTATKMYSKNKLSLPYVFGFKQSL